MDFMDNQLPQTVSELIERVERNQESFVKCQRKPLSSQYVYHLLRIENDLMESYSWR